MRRYLIILITLCTTLAACGEGGGGGQAASTSVPTKAIVKLMTSGTLTSGTLIGGIDITIPLPAGVSVKSTADSVNSSVLVTNAGVVTASGVAAGTNATAMGTYTSNPNAVTIKVVNPAGFGTGEFVTVNCDIAAGTTVTTVDFSTDSFSAVDLNGEVISGLTPSVMAVELQ